MDKDERKLMNELIKDMKHWTNSELHYAFDFCEQHHGEFWTEFREAIRQEITNKGGRT